MIDVAGFIKKNKKKQITFMVWFYTGVFRLLIFFLPMKYLKKHFGIEGEESKEEAKIEQYRYAKMISDYVNRSSNHTLWESKCLVRALTAQKLLNRKQIDSTLYLGVGKEEDKMIAHAWLRCGRMYVTGGDGSNYAIVAKYKMDYGEVDHIGEHGRIL